MAPSRGLARNINSGERLLEEHAGRVFGMFQGNQTKRFPGVDRRARVPVCVASGASWSSARASKSRDQDWKGLISLGNHGRLRQYNFVCKLSLPWRSLSLSR